MVALSSTRLSAQSTVVLQTVVFYVGDWDHTTPTPDTDVPSLSCGDVPVSVGVDADADADDDTPFTSSRPSLTTVVVWDVAAAHRVESVLASFPSLHVTNRWVLGTLNDLHTVVYNRDPNDPRAPRPPSPSSCWAFESPVPSLTPDASTSGVITNVQVCSNARSAAAHRHAAFTRAGWSSVSVPASSAPFAVLAVLDYAPPTGPPNLCVHRDRLQHLFGSKAVDATCSADVGRSVLAELGVWPLGMPRPVPSRDASAFAVRYHGTVPANQAVSGMPIPFHRVLATMFSTFFPKEVFPSEVGRLTGLYHRLSHLVHDLDYQTTDRVPDADGRATPIETAQLVSLYSKQHSTLLLDAPEDAVWLEVRVRLSFILHHTHLLNNIYWAEELTPTPTCASPAAIARHWNATRGVTMFKTHTPPTDPEYPGRAAHLQEHLDRIEAMARPDVLPKLPITFVALTQSWDLKPTLIDGTHRAVALAVAAHRGDVAADASSATLFIGLASSLNCTELDSGRKLRAHQRCYPQWCPATPPDPSVTPIFMPVQVPPSSVSTL